MNDFDDEQASYYMDEDEIVIDILLYQMTAEVIKQFKQYDPHDLEALHEKIGHPIRNYYRLYELENPYVNNVPGTQSNCREISKSVVERLWTCLTNKQITKQEILTSDDAVGC